MGVAACMVVVLGEPETLSEDCVFTPSAPVGLPLDTVSSFALLVFLESDLVGTMLKDLLKHHHFTLLWDSNTSKKTECMHIHLTVIHHPFPREHPWRSLPTNLLVFIISFQDTTKYEQTLSSMCFTHHKSTNSSKNGILIGKCSYSIRKLCVVTRHPL